MKNLNEKIIYQVYPLSFCDSNSDGVGDLKGIISKLDYLKKMNIDYIWISPIYKSPMFDNGYDVADYYSINDTFGEMREFELLVEESGKRNIGIIMDIVMNHTSNKCNWFLKSENNIPPYNDYYVWRKEIPEGFKSQFENNAWTYSDSKGMYYLHHFLKEQPDLNWDNPYLINEFSKIINFWIKKGVKGFRFDVIDMLGKDIKKGKTISIDRAYKRIREIGSKSWLKHDDIFTVGECWSTNEKYQRKYIDKKNGVFSTFFYGDHMFANFYGSRWNIKHLEKNDFIKFKKNIFRNRKLNSSVLNLSNFIENHDFPRSISRYFPDDGFHEEKAKTILISFFGFPGPSFIYQGQELGYVNPKFSLNKYKDPETINFIKKTNDIEINKKANSGTRDNARTFILWKKEDMKSKKWLNPDFVEENFVDDQENNNNSTLNFYRDFLRWKKSKSFILSNGKLIPIMVDDEHIFGYQYLFKNSKIVFLANWSYQKKYISEFKNMKIIFGKSNTNLGPYESVVLEETKEGINEKI